VRKDPQPTQIPSKKVSSTKFPDKKLTTISLQGVSWRRIDTKYTRTHTHKTKNLLSMERGVTSRSLDVLVLRIRELEEQNRDLVSTRNEVSSELLLSQEKVRVLENEKKSLLSELERKRADEKSIESEVEVSFSPFPTLMRLSPLPLSRSFPTKLPILKHQSFLLFFV
jgi:hypothetical protein